MSSQAKRKIIWTIGHSTHSLADLVSMLRSFQIEGVADIRNFPGSRRYPHFNKAELEVSLPHNSIHYNHIIDLGGRRKPNPESVNTGWRHKAFRGYADYMETDEFKAGIDALQTLANKETSAYMCSEAMWWRCHRSLVSDYLKSKGWTVMHIMGIAKSEEHPYTSTARIVNGSLTYKEVSLF